MLRLGNHCFGSLYGVLQDKGRKIGVGIGDGAHQQRLVFGADA